MKILDSHIHFWDPDHLRYEWLKSVPDINKPFLPADLIEQSGRHQLEKILFVQAGAHPADALAEVEWVTQLAQQERRIAGIVADAPLEKGAVSVEPHLKILSQNRLVKGVRRLIQGEPKRFATAPDFVAAVRSLATFQFSFDICVFHSQLGEVVELVAQVPEVSFVLDHFGKPGIKAHDAAIDTVWREEITQLATYPNVWCKLSGLITEADHNGWSQADLQPYIDHVITQFGPQRLMYGGDWPVSLLASERWSEWVEVAFNSLHPLSEAEKQDVFYNNGAQFYRLDS